MLAASEYPVLLGLDGIAASVSRVVRIAKPLSCKTFAGFSIAPALPLRDLNAPWIVLPVIEPTSVAGLTNGGQFFGLVVNLVS